MSPTAAGATASCPSCGCRARKKRESSSTKSAFVSSKAAATLRCPASGGAVAGTDAPAPRWGEHGALYERAWTWKDNLLSAGRHYYGSALGNYRLFMARALLPYLWAISDLNYGGDPDDYLELYEDGKLSLDAKNVYSVLRQLGPSSTTVLRRQSGLYGKGPIWGRFQRALEELQHGLLIAAVGIAHDNAWKYTFRYATLPDAFPEEVAAARNISGREAMAYLLVHYVDLVGATSVKAATKLFGWSEDRCLRTARALLEEGVLLGDPGGGPLLAPELVGERAGSS